MPDFEKLKAEARCACGRHLHYPSNAMIRRTEYLFPDGDHTVVITTPDGQYRVQRHYLALHGVKASDLADLAARDIVEKLP